MRYVSPFVFFVSLIILVSCSKKQENDLYVNLPIYDRLTHILVPYDECPSIPLILPDVNYLIINSLDELNAQPAGTIAPVISREAAHVDYSKRSLIVVWSLFSTENKWPYIDYSFYHEFFREQPVIDIRWYYAKPASVDISFENLGVSQFAFTTDKLPSDTQIIIAEGVISE